METKFCPKCEKDKNVEDFYYRKTEKRHQSYCKICLCQIQMDRWIERKKLAVEYKGGKCIKCGYNKNYAVLNFHHRNPEEKDFEWVKLRLKSWDKIIKELDKCDLLCSNCHIELHNPKRLCGVTD